MSGAPQVAVAGEIFIDLIFSGLDEWPRPGKETFARNFHRELGGGTAITACALASLGTECSVFACTGADAYGWIVSRLAEFGVDNEIRIDTSEPTAITMILTQPHDRAFLTYEGANRAFYTAFVEAIQSGCHVPRRHLHMAFAPPPDAASELIEPLKAKGCSISVDVGWRENWLKDSRSSELLRQIDIFFPNETEARCMTGLGEPEAMLNWFASRNIRRVVLKLGTRGAAMLWDGEIHFSPGHAATAIDTTGAGDCFDAGFLHAWLSGEDPADCLRAGNMCGALSTQALGGLNALKSEAWRRIKERKGLP